jgi:hypothetical protein
MAVASMGITITRRSNDLNFEYCIVINHSFPEDDRTNLLYRSPAEKFPIAAWRVMKLKQHIAPSANTRRLSGSESHAWTGIFDRLSFLKSEDGVRSFSLRKRPVSRAI